jgi:hypothetical protein
VLHARAQLRQRGSLLLANLLELRTRNTAA